MYYMIFTILTKQVSKNDSIKLRTFMNINNIDEEGVSLREAYFRFYEKLKKERVRTNIYIYNAAYCITIHKLNKTAHVDRAHNSWDDCVSP